MQRQFTHTCELQLMSVSEGQIREVFFSRIRLFLYFLKSGNICYQDRNTCGCNETKSQRVNVGRKRISIIIKELGIWRWWMCSTWYPLHFTDNCCLESVISSLSRNTKKYCFWHLSRSTGFYWLFWRNLTHHIGFGRPHGRHSFWLTWNKTIENTLI